jgi:hypothetical protein
MTRGIHRIYQLVIFGHRCLLVLPGKYFSLHDGDLKPLPAIFQKGVTTW